MLAAYGLRDRFSGRCSLGLAGAATDLGQQQVDTERGVLVVEITLQLGNLLAQHIGCVTNTSDDTETTSVGDRGCQFGASGHVHTRQQDGVVDLEQIGNGGTDYLCRSHMLAWSDGV